MGYRTYIGYIPKEEYNKIKDYTVKEIYEHKNKNYNKEDEVLGEYLGSYELVTELYGFGKYTEFDDKKFYKKVFSNIDTDKFFCRDGDFWIVEKEYLEHIIDHYFNKVKGFYEEMLIPFINKNKYSEFLNTIKLEYDQNHNANHTFDFSKITQEQQNAFFKIIEHIRNNSTDWGVNTIFKDHRPYNLTRGDEITTSWKYEYNVFELVRIYKTFDWENNIMIYYGW